MLSCTKIHFAQHLFGSMQQTGLAASVFVLYNGVYLKQMRISFRKLRNFTIMPKRHAA